MSAIQRVYIAGFEVFLPYYRSVFKKYETLCRDAGVTALVPFEVERHPAANESEKEKAERIVRRNMQMIHDCDAVIANLNFFRGFEPDSGTAFEVGYATALQKPVVGYYQNQNTLRGRIQLHARREKIVSIIQGSRMVYGDQVTHIEEFGFPVNIMLACNAHLVCGDFKHALQKVTHILRQK
jgi:nucleoside 2-deoxyribosyltransferase